MTTQTKPDPVLPPLPEIPEHQWLNLLDMMRGYGRACYDTGYAQARADLLAEMQPVAWRYQTPTGWHATTDAGKALVLRDHHPTEPLAIIPKE